MFCPLYALDRYHSGVFAAEKAERACVNDSCR